jgi:hypothetical protein
MAKILRFFLCLFETEFHSVAQTSLDLTIFCFRLPNPGIIGMHHHTKPIQDFFLSKFIIGVEKSTDLCMLPLTPATFLDLFIISNSFLMKSLVFHV